MKLTLQSGVQSCRQVYSQKVCSIARKIIGIIATNKSSSSKDQRVETDKEKDTIVGATLDLNISINTDSNQSSMSQQIVWQPGNWAKGCDWPRHEFETEETLSVSCSEECRKTPGCSHYTWNSGTCYMKSGPVNQSEATSSGDDGDICGFL